MKATKIASGFAVSALAAAVSMSATAGVTVNGDDAVDGSASWSGHVEVGAHYILNNEESYKTADTNVDKDREVTTGDHRLKASFSVEEGPYSGSLHMGTTDGDDVSVVNVTVGDIQYDDGAFLFSNSVGSIIITEGSGIEGLSGDLSFGANGGFRYYDNVKALGLGGLKFKVQLERPQYDHDSDGDTDEIGTPTPFGVAAAFDFKKPGTNTQIMANVQLADADGAGDNERNFFATPFYGVQLVDNSIPKTTLTAVLNSGQQLSADAVDADDLADNFEAIMTYGVKAHYNGVGANGGFSAYASYAQENQNAETSVATATAGAGYVLQDVQDKTKKTSLNVDSKFALVEGADATPMEVKATIRQDLNYLYATAHYIFVNEEAADTVYAEAGTQSTNNFSAKAGYEMTIEEVDGVDNSNMMFAEAHYSLDVKNGIDTMARFEQRHGETKLLKDDETEAAKSIELQLSATYELDGGATVTGMYEMDTDNGSGDDIDSDDAPEFTDKFTFTASYSF